MFKNEEVINKLTLKQKASLFSGKSTWETFSIPELVPSIFLSDGPHGIRKQLGESDHLGLNESVPATCFPTAATLANSWDEKLIESVGEALGDEAKKMNVQVILGPGLNIKRNPKCGRNFEYFSEDPFVAGKLAAASIRGIQKNKTIASPKHFAVNSQEFRRMASDSIVDERTLREIYTTGFEIAVKEGNPKAIMSSYNLINGTYANENKELLRDLLVDEWGFDGFVVSDWGGDNNHVKGVKNGSHLAMPSLGNNGPIEIIKAVETGELDEATLDKRTDELLSVILNSTANSESDESIDFDGHHQLAQKAAMESIVLLKNTDHLLPLNNTKKVGVVGDFAKTPRYQGAGSSVVNPKKLESTLDVIDNYPIELTGFAQGFKRGQKKDEQLEQDAVKLAEASDVILLYVGLDEILESEGMDREHTQMPENQLSLIDTLSKTSAKIVVVLCAGSSFEMPWKDNVDSILHGYLGGEAGASAILEVVTGSHNPSGKLSETYPISYNDVPFGEEFPYKGKYAYYKEGIFVGYRYYDSRYLDVLFPFGYGLSYTTFDYSNLKIEKEKISFKITNTGNVKGTEIAQLYIGKKDSQIVRPVRELKGFNKVVLDAGESKEIEIKLDDKAFRYFNVDTNKWEKEDGTYQLVIGGHSRDNRLSGELTVKGTQAEPPERELLLSKYKNGLINDITIEDFAVLYGKNVPIESLDKRQSLNENSVISEMNRAKNPLARLTRKTISQLITRSEKKGKPNLNLLFIYNMPFRAIGKMSNGMVSQEMIGKILVMVNGHFFKGFGGLIKEYRRNKRQSKEFTE